MPMGVSQAIPLSASLKKAIYSPASSKERGNKEGELLNERGSTTVMQLRDSYHKRSRARKEISYSYIGLYFFPFPLSLSWAAFNYLLRFFQVMTGFPICLGNLSEDIAQDDAFLDGLFGLALDSPQTSIPVNLVKKTGAAEVPDSGEVGIELHLSW